MEARKKNIIIGIAAAVVAAEVTASLIIAVTTMRRVNAIQAATADESGDVAQEDDVTIAGNYIIRSTKVLSDAYRSGSTAGLNDRQKETLQMAVDALKEMGVTDGMSNYDKELTVYRWMAANIGTDSGALPVIPTAQADGDNPYGVLKTHTAVCVGYATTFRLFMQMMGIECTVVHNVARVHSWDLVKLDDGCWYHVDIYSDAGKTSYENFNMNDDQCAVNHEWNRDFFAAATGTQYNYAYQNRKMLASVYEIPAAFKAVLKDGGHVAFYGITGGMPTADGYALKAIMADLQATLISDAKPFGDGTFGYSLAPVGGNDYTITIYFDNTDDTPQPEANLTEQQRQQVTEAMKKAFGDKYVAADASAYQEQSLTNGADSK